MIYRNVYAMHPVTGELVCMMERVKFPTTGDKNVDNRLNLCELDDIFLEGFGEDDILKYAKDFTDYIFFKEIIIKNFLYDSEKNKIALEKFVELIEEKYNEICGLVSRKNMCYKRYWEGVDYLNRMQQIISRMKEYIDSLQ